MLMWTFAEILINFYQAFLMTYYVNHRCDLRDHQHISNVVLAACIGIAICILDVISIYVLDNLVFLLPLLFAYVYRKDHFIDSVFWCLLLNIIFSINSILASNIVSILTGAEWEDMLEQNDIRFIYIISANLLHTTMIATVCNIGRKGGTVSFRITACFLLSLLAQFAAAECFFVIRVQASEYMPLAMYGSLGLFISMILTVSLYEMMISEAEEKRQLELETQTTHLIEAHHEELRTIYSNMLSTQHDLRHRIAAAEAILSKKENSSSQEAIDMLKETNVLNEFITGSIGIDAILAAKKSVMKEAGINFIFYPCPLSELPISENDFVVLMSNILDNAIEAVMRLPSSASSRQIQLSLSRTWDIFSISCENDMNMEYLQQKNGVFISSKSQPDLHGYGTRSIQRIVDKAGGLVDFIYDHNHFAVKIMLPMGD